MTTTNWLLPQTIIQNDGWSSPENVLLKDGSFAFSGTASPNATSVTVGNFLANLPANAIPSGIEIEVSGYRGPLSSPATTLEIFAWDNTNANSFLYQYLPEFSGLSTTVGDYVFGGASYLFGQSLTADQVNNLKFRLIANGEVYLDSVRMRVHYAENDASVPASTGTCTKIVQAQEFRLDAPVSANDTEIVVNEFVDSSGTDITTADLANGPLDITVDDGIRGKEENMKVTAITVLSGSSRRLSVTRGWSFKDPSGQSVSRQKSHGYGSSVVISNSQPFYDMFLRKCHVGTLVSAPIKAEDEGVSISGYLRKLNFKGSGVVATATPALAGGGHDVDVTVNGYGNQPITIINTTNVSSGGSQVTNLSSNITAEGTDTALIVSVSLEAGKTVTGVTYNSLPLAFAGAQVQNDVRVEAWYMANPSGGNHTVNATFSAATYSCFEAVSMSGVDQTTPLVGLTGNGGNSASSTGTVTTVAANSTFFHALATREIGMTYTAGLGETINGTSLSGAVQGAIASRLVGTPSAQGSQINLSISDDWANLLFAIQPTPVLPPVITTGVASVTSSDPIVPVDNTDPQNPIVGFDIAALITSLLASSTFISGISAALLALPSFISGLISNLTTNSSFINALTSNSLFQTNVNAFVSGGGKLIQDMTPYFSSSTSTAWRTMYTETVPGGTLGTSNSLRVSLINASVNSGGTPVNWSIRISYGGTVLSTLTVTPGSATSFNETYSFSSLISAGGTSASQFSTSSVVPESQQYISPQKVQNVMSGSASVDSSLPQDIVVEVVNSTSFATVDFAASGILIEKIS